MKSYFEQMANMQTDYANQANTQIDQLGVDINQRFDENVVKPLNVLQQHLKTMNDNLLSLGTWLGNQDVFAKEGGGWTPPTSVLSSLSNLPGLPPHAEVQENFGAAQAALEELLTELHGSPALDEDKVMPILSKLTSQMKHLHKTLLQGPASSPNASHAVLRLMRDAQAQVKALPKESFPETFKRRVITQLQPAVRRWQNQARVVATVASSLSSLSLSQFGVTANTGKQQSVDLRKYENQKLMTLIHRDVSVLLPPAGPLTP